MLLFFVISLLCWAVTGSWANGIPVNVVSLLQNTLTASIPLILGALAGCMGERAGVINIAIEGQLLLGAFTAAVVASAVGVLWLGLIGGSLAGGLVGLVLALFAIRWLVNQIILGVVLNLLISGITGYLYDRLLVPDANTYNSAEHVQRDQGPGDWATSRSSGRSSSTRRCSCTSPTRRSSPSRSACSAPGGGCGYARWASTRRRPTRSASRCNGIRYGNLIMGGMLAGIGGAYLTIGSVGTFSKDMSLRAGLHRPGRNDLRPVDAARGHRRGAAVRLHRGAAELSSAASTVPISTRSCSAWLPYVATIVAVAGLVGRVRAPAADGKPYVRA